MGMTRGLFSHMEMARFDCSINKLARHSNDELHRASYLFVYGRLVYASVGSTPSSLRTSSKAAAMALSMS